MERKALEYDQNRWKAVLARAGKGDPLISALSALADSYYSRDVFSRLWKELTKLYGVEPHQVRTVEQFWAPALAKAVQTLTDRDYAAKFPALMEMRMEGQFSTSPFRRSYRSKNLGYYASDFVTMLGRLIRNYYYAGSTYGKLLSNHDDLYGYEYLLALELRQGNAELIAPVREAIYGENTQILLSRKIIEAVVISANEELTDDLLKLLVAARLQEGLRQQILESADKGSIQTLGKILKLCLDEDLFRYSSAVRALDVWTGLGCDDTRPERARKCGRLAYEALTDEAKRKEYIDSSDNLEVYFALWGQGCHEIAVTYQMAERLLDDARHSRRVLGWYFIRHSDSSRFQMALASRYLGERDEELLAWIVSNLSSTFYLVSPSCFLTGRPNSIPNSDLPDKLSERRRLFSQLKELAAVIGDKHRSFQGNPFPWTSITLENRQVINCMMSLAGYDMDREQVDGLLDAARWMDADQKQALTAWFLLPKTNADHRAFLRRMLDDRSVSVKEKAVQKLSECRLLQEDLDELCHALRSKSSGLRKAILSLLQSQPRELLAPVIRQILCAEEEYEIQAAIEMLMADPELINENKGALDALRDRKLSTQTEILLNQLLPGKEEQTLYTKETGFGLYKPEAVSDYQQSLSSASAAAPKRGLLSKLFNSAPAKADLMSERQIKALIPTWQEYDAVLSRIDQVFSRHVDYEYEVEYYDGSRHKLLWGDIAQMSLPMPASSGCRSLSDPTARPDMLPFWEEFLEALGDYARDPEKMLGLHCLSTRHSGPYFYGNVVTEPWFLPIEKKDLAPQMHDQARKKYKRYWVMTDILNALPKLLDPHRVFVPALRLYKSMLSVIGEENLSRIYMRRSDGLNISIAYGNTMSSASCMNHRMLCIWRDVITRLPLPDEDFAAWFQLEYRLEKLAGSTVFSGLSTTDYFRAYDKQLIPRDVLMAFLADPENAMPGKIKVLTNPVRWREGAHLYESYPWARELMDEFLDRVVTVEEKRGELPTDVTAHCLAIERFEGAQHFCNLLAALGKESFFRGYEYSRDTTKKAVLSRLLKRCYPANGDTPELLAALLKKTDISDRRLAEAVMYAPQWAGFAEAILDWPGLKCGVWFFHAHINETFSAEKETETAIFSPITPQQFNDGAFDKNWFFEAYNKLREKRFEILYKSAKYITTGNSQHRRSQLYADAVLGKLDAGELRAEISDKRNQEKLRCYPLIPIAEGDTKEALERYEFIQKFLKESRQFGAQRRESERKACATAMENLAITTGLMDVNRLMWQMESAKLDEIRPMLQPVELDGVSARLAIDKNGDAAVILEKGGKALKTVPKSLNKDETFLELKATAKELKEQKRRARESLERAMTDCTEFTREELLNILQNPVLAPMLRTLVWVSSDAVGFLSCADGALLLTAVDGMQAEATDALRLAHPHDLKTVGVWADYMRLLYDKKWVQPFKQVFREYYPLTADEKQERTISRRYAGHQVQPQRTVALLKGRGWTVDYEEGLQKVFYKENLIVRMYALADWFSPADIEAPTLETVEFFDRTTKENVPLEAVPPVLFSETMRDLDLVVSVAHVGGVDPEASHSTMEMRIAIASELVRLLKLSNVSWVGSHAKIAGQLGNYSVHMGSGIVHAQGKGMLTILPVHSQARGRIFLPFADDDPKTAEIMSKIILLAEDTKIKDPGILGQL